MSRFYLRLILLPLLIFAAALVLIHAQPYDDHELRQLLAPEGCPAPCFMGIHPGVTTMGEALKLMQASDLFKDVRVHGRRITWNWDNLKSAWIASPRGGVIRLEYRTRLVDAIFLKTNISIGEVQLALGPPDLEYMGRSHIENHEITYFGLYNNGFEMHTYLTCKIVEPFRNPIDIMIALTAPGKSEHIFFVNDMFHVC